MNYRVAINATRFTVNITADTPLGTPIIYFSITVENTYFNNPQAVLLSIVRNHETERVFKLGHGANDEDIFYGVLNPRPADSFPNFTVERYIIYDNVPSDVLPAVFDFDINVVVVARSGSGLSPPFEDAMSLGEVTVKNFSFSKLIRG